MDKLTWIVRYAREFKKHLKCGWDLAVDDAEAMLEMYEGDTSEEEPEEAANESLSEWAQD